MDGFEDGNSTGETAGLGDGRPFADNSSGSTVFDASQYAFFGGDVVEEVELGGLEDEEEEIPAVVPEDDTFQLDQEEMSPHLEGDGLGSLSDIDDLTHTFSKLNKVVSGPNGTAIVGNRGARESSSAAEWTQDTDYSPWYDQQTYDAESAAERQRWLSHPYSSSADSGSIYRTSSYPEPQPQLYQQHFSSEADPRSLYRTSSYPEPLPQPQQQHFSSEPIPVPKSSFPSFPPAGGRLPQSSPNQVPHPNIPYLAAGPQVPRSSQNISPFSGPPSGLPRGSHLGGNLSQFSPPGRPPSQWANQMNMYPGDRANILSNMMQQLPQQNGMMPSQFLSQQQQQQQQQRLHHQVQLPYGNVTGLHPQLYGHQLAPSPPLLNKFDNVLGISDLRDQRARSSQRNRPNFRYSPQGFDGSNQRGDSGWPQFRSKYMSAEEIENILRMQLAATHSNDPYVDDYYHQACLSKKTAGARLKHHFCPTHLRDLPPRARANNEPHAFLQVEALGRVPFSSIRRPRPLLDVDSSNSSSPGSTEQKVFEKPLEQEPLLAARVTIEDCLCLLLDVDDIDRFLEFNQLPDAGAELRQRRQSQLEELASSLQLVDPLGKDGQAVGSAPKDDVVFLRIVSLPKGRKLLSKYVQMLFPGGELLRVVCMAIFRHLRFLFGIVPSDPLLSATSANLAKVVSSCVQGMDLNTVSACLAAVVCSSEQPPLRPIGSPAGDGASIILKAILDRATELLRDSNAASSYNMPNRAFWQASFDEFFGLLTKYCVSKYDSIVQPLLMQASPNMATIESDVARAIKKEMPVDLLRASLPHTNENQKKQLLDFAQRTLPAFSGHAAGSGNHAG